jgi:hypothetical protein
MLRPLASRATPATRRGVAPDPVDGSWPGEVEGAHTVEVVGERVVVVAPPVVVSVVGCGAWPAASGT